ncbi:MAG: cbb3-type cytochrome oxidase assembly protein CcoS [Betaproteobacteria bacterium]|jgi:cbb3-type cytochrome oxidase maturation protein|nr:cbb3-type cytochrome oxidase assembly protein CcoS [Betaproteobacteria bacterium]
MEVLMLLIPLSVVLVALIAGAFWWSVRSGQFDDLEGPAHRILADDDRAGAAHDVPAGETRDMIEIKPDGEHRR